MMSGEGEEREELWCERCERYYGNIRAMHPEPTGGNATLKSVHQSLQALQERRVVGGEWVPLQVRRARLRRRGRAMSRSVRQ